MTVYFADTSALLRSYLPGEADSAALRALLLEGDDPVLASRLVDVEAPRAFVTAARWGRLPVQQLRPLLDQYDRDVGSGRRVELLALDHDAVTRARELVLVYALRTLDALHLAVAEGEGRRLAEPDSELVFVTRVDAQREVATSLGFRTA
jgi:predicted nucleic acid-binding protein